MQLNWLTFEKRINFYTFPIRFKSLKYQAPNITLFTPRVQQFCGWPAANFNISYKHKLSKHENVSDFTQFIGAFWVPCDSDTNFSLPLYMSREFKLHEWNLVNKQQERIMRQRGKRPVWHLGLMWIAPINPWIQSKPVSGEVRVSI